MPPRSVPQEADFSRLPGTAARVSLAEAMCDNYFGEGRTHCRLFIRLKLNSVFGLVYQPREAGAEFANLL